MTQSYDLVIRNGLIVDGTGSEPYTGDVAINGGKIAAVGRVDGTGKKEIEARGRLVTPGFVDVHTHYDGQSIWSEHLNPSSAHGVTTVVFGNCGVGFAPCRPQSRDLLIKAMEGVEDIPGVVMTEGLTWEWETFPEFLDALERRRHDIDFAAYVPHSALRVYVMGERGANRDPATDEDIARMVQLTGEAMKAGAVGFATSRIKFHRRIDGELLPTYKAAERELHAIAKEVGRYGGIFQVVPELTESDNEDEAKLNFEILRKISREGKVPVTFSLGQANEAPDRFPRILDWVAKANEEPGVQIRPQIFPRPVGVILSLNSSANPFMGCPTYKKLASLPLAQRIAELKKPEVRKAIINEESEEALLPLMRMSRKFEVMYPMGETPNYEPDPSTSIVETARRKGVSPDEVAYDILMERDGRGMILVAIANYTQGSLEYLRDIMLQKAVVIGLGDGGAHYGLICDGSYPTFMLSHWGRDRAKGRLPLSELVRTLTSVPAGLVGFKDRGRLAVGLKADINVIDLERLRLHQPTIQADLPAGGRRLDQTASGYQCTIVNGKIIQNDGVRTGELPGRLVRAGKTRAVSAAAE
jgi:N-acyl-D-aspartate/D-glutamate deacylase